MKKISLLIPAIIVSIILNAQAIISVSPDSAQTGTHGLAVQISGTGTSFNQGTSIQVYFSQASSTYLTGYNTVVSSATVLTTYIDIPYGTNTGLYDLAVNTIGGTVSLPSAFNVKAGPAPQITYVDTNYSSLGTTLDVTISGTGTNFQSGSSTVWFSQGSSTIIPNLVSITSPVSLIANITIPAGGPAGFYDVNVYDPIDNTLTLPYGFFVSDSTIGIVSVTGDSTTYNLGDSGITLIITGAGTNFAAQGDTTIVWLGQVHNRSEVPNIFPVSTQVISNTQINATFYFPANVPPGYYDLFAFNKIDGELTKEMAIDLTSTGIESINPNNIKVYPNPVGGKLFIRYNDQEVITSISLTSVSGASVMKKAATGNNPEVIDLTNTDPGIYILAITDQAGAVNYRKIFVE